MENRYCFPCEDKDSKDCFEKKVELIYDCLVDEISKEIFSKRVLYSLTSDYQYMREMLIKTGVGVKFSTALDECDKPIYVYGAGTKGTRVVNIFSEKKWRGYIDKKKQGEHNGLPVYSLENNEEIKEAIVLVSNLVKPHLIKQELIELGVPEDSVLVLNDFDRVIGQNQYFDDACIGGLCNLDSYFVDVGCYDGEETKRYLEWCKDKEAPVIAFEADAKNFQVCKAELENYSNVTLYNYGLSDKAEKKKFRMTMSPSSQFSDEGDVEVETVTLDSIAGDKRVGFIKMDVEGYEEKCLLGAKQIISQQRPILAISVYHKREDIWNLPQVILEMNPQYRFYLRHYTVGVTDTVLYAVDKSVLQ